MPRKMSVSPLERDVLWILEEAGLLVQESSGVCLLYRRRGSTRGPGDWKDVLDHAWDALRARQARSASSQCENEYARDLHFCSASFGRRDSR
jgi:hypothetical protein